MLLTVAGRTPHAHESSWVAPTAVVTGNTVLGADVSIWYSAVVRADFDEISIGARSNVQDGAVLHTDPGLQLVVGPDVTIGHRAVLHGCRIESNVLVGMGAIIMNGVVIGSDSIIASGALIPEGVVIPPGSLVMGAPAKVRRETSEDERALIRISVEEYVTLMLQHRQA